MYQRATLSSGSTLRLPPQVRSAHCAAALPQRSTLTRSRASLQLHALHTALIQSRGRARAEGSKLVWFCADKKTGGAEVSRLLTEERYTREAARALACDVELVNGMLALRRKLGARRFMTDDAAQVLEDYLERPPKFTTVKAPVSIPNTYKTTITGFKPGEGLPDEVSGEPRRGEPAAIAAAAYEACLILHGRRRFEGSGIAGDRFTLLKLTHNLARHQAPTDDATAQWASASPAPTAPASGAAALAPAKARLNEWVQRNRGSLSKPTFTQHGEGEQSSFRATVTIGQLSATSAPHPRKKLAENDACEQMLAQLAERDGAER